MRCKGHEWRNRWKLVGGAIQILHTKLNEMTLCQGTTELETIC